MNDNTLVFLKTLDGRKTSRTFESRYPNELRTHPKPDRYSGRLLCTNPAFSAGYLLPEHPGKLYYNESRENVNPLGWFLPSRWIKTFSH